MKASTYIFGYTDADDRDEVVLCAKCGEPYQQASPNEWRILRVDDAVKYPSGRECDQCMKQVYFVNGVDRLKVYADYLETLDF